MIDINDCVASTVDFGSLEFIILKVFINTASIDVNIIPLFR